MRHEVGSSRKKQPASRKKPEEVGEGGRAPRAYLREIQRTDAKLFLFRLFCGFTLLELKLRLYALLALLAVEDQ